VLIVLAITVMSIRRQRADTFEERLGRYTEPSALLSISEEADQEQKEKEKKESALAQKLDTALETRKFAQGWRTQLARADLKLTVSEYLALHVISMLGLAMLAFFILTPGQAVQTIIAGGIGFFLPRLYVNNKQGKRLKDFEGQLPDLLGLWVNSLRSGYSVLQALEAISREAPPPTSIEIKRVVMEVQIGITMEDALDHLLLRMPSEDLDLIVTAVNIQREVGGNLAEILEVISHTIRERIKIKGEIRVLTAQGRVTGYLIAGLPIVLGAFLFLINPTYMGRMFTNRGCGWPMIAISFGLIGIGWTIINRIVDIEV
jgi:tight adherence protein B